MNGPGAPADSGRDERAGTLLGLSAYLLWGLFPLYWKGLAAVPPVQVLAHRVLWAFVLTMGLSLATAQRRRELAALLRTPRRAAAMLAAGLLVTLNWGIYIWAVSAGNIVESSMGYYLNPLVSVALGALVLRERVDAGMVASCVVAGVGIAIAAVSYGRVPWTALSLAVSFALYGLIKKLVGLDALTGLAAETAAALPWAIGFLALEHAAGRGSFGHAGAGSTAMLVLAGPVTAIPLILYAAGVKRIPLSRMGFLQYVSPTLQLALGTLVFGEVLDGPRAAAFGFVLAALAIFALTRKRVA